MSILPTFLQTQRTPRELDTMRDNAFLFQIQRLPQTSYFCQEVNLPNISLGVASQETPFVKLKTPGDKLTFGDLRIVYLVQEDMSNYVELFNWMIGLGFPESRDQFADLEKEDFNPRVPLAKQFPSSVSRGQYSDATLFINNSDNVPVMEVRFEDCFPVDLDIPALSTTSQTPGPVKATASFAFRQFSLRKLRDRA
jgi:hypothetical protein